MRLFKPRKPKEPWRTLLEMGSDGWVISEGTVYGAGLTNGNIGLRIYGYSDIALCDHTLKDFCNTGNTQVKAFFAECLFKASPEESE